MSELTVPELAALDARGFAEQVKTRLRDDRAWVMMLEPVLVDRTRLVLANLIESIDWQKVRAANGAPPDPSWLRNIDKLRGYAKKRLDAMPPSTMRVVSSSKEARAWRAFSARLARALGILDPVALDRLRTPYGDMTAREWLAAREGKR